MTQEVTQLDLRLTVQTSRDVNGEEMGVLSDGTAYLSQKALSRLCGVANSSISDLTTDWSSGKRKTKLASWLAFRGFSRDEVCIRTEKQQFPGTYTLAYQEDVCNLILEYYAFEAPVQNKTAQGTFRKLAAGGLRLFVYSLVGYNPTKAIADSWRHFHDRLLLNNAPPGYFTVFGESYTIIASAIKGGLMLDHHTIPDGSMGIQWSKHWVEKGLEAKFGARIHYPHFWPNDHPQSAVNPIEAWAYPDAVLAEFRRWREEEYIPERLPKYLGAKIKEGRITGTDARKLLGQLAADRIPKRLKSKVD